MRPQPLLQHQLAEGAGFEMAVDEGNHVVRLGFQPRAVEAEKDVHAGESHALVAVPLVHGEAFPQRSGLFDQIGIVAGLRAQQRRLDQAEVAHALGAAEQAQLLGVDIERIVKGDVVHLFRQRFVDLGPAPGAFGMETLSRRADAAARGLGQTAKFFWRQHHRHVAALPLHTHRLGLRHVDQFAKTVLGIGGGECFHERKLAELANLGKARQSTQ